MVIRTYSSFDKLSAILRLDYGGLGPFCSTHANMEFLSHVLISQLELYIIR